LRVYAICHSSFHVEQTVSTARPIPSRGAVGELLQENEALAADLEATPMALALAWLLSRPDVTAPVLGPRTLDQLTGSFPALDVTIGDETSTRLDELFPGPGDEARRPTPGP
jgi:aryl-alcohol dehydrogenase-like predicted oxidoreductase